MRVLIRADASLVIGSGHVMRCLTLARVLSRQGAEVVFACRQSAGHLLPRIVDQGYAVVVLPEHYDDEQGGGPQHGLAWQADIQALCDAVADTPRFDWLIVDHYGLGMGWETSARRLADHLMAIDDLPDRPHAVDLLLDQNLSAQVHRQSRPASQQDRCRQLLGPRFALLRDEFRCAAVEIKPTAQRLLVNFGGFDAACQVHATLLALESFDDLQVDFVAGLDNPMWETMREIVGARSGWRLHALADDFFGLMQQADLFIGAGGGTTWERAALGLPTICISVADNQQLNARLMAQAGAHLYLGPHETLEPQRLAQAVATLRDNPELRQSFAARSRALVDGQGASRVAAALAQPLLHMRRAGMQDASLLFQGRNAPHVRRWSLNTEVIPWETHLSWFSESLDNPQRLVLIGETTQGIIGMVRYDRQGESADVSIYLLEAHVGIGWGRTLLSSGERFMRRCWPQVRLLQAQVLAENAASVSLFQKAGYAQAPRYFQRVIDDE